MAAALKIDENVTLAPFTTFRVGGRARYFTDVRSEKELREALEFASDARIGVFVLGGGSNVLISDSGFKGLVIRIALRGISRMDLPDSGSGHPVMITAMAGEDWDEFVGWSVERDLGGIECLSGIPGLVGGTPIQNVGAYGQEVSETIVSVRTLDRITREVRDISRDECGFGYRRSIFNTVAKERYIVLSVTYELRKGGPPKIAYKDLQESVGDDATLKDVRAAVRRIRASKGMLVRQGGADARSAGSFFKNPIVGPEVLGAIAAKAAAEGLEVPKFPADGDNVKVPAAWLIEQSGFQKGYTKGNAGLSTVHALALTNRGGASAAEIVALRDEISQRVEDLWGVTLEPEPNFIGFEGSD
jgi:UDP-N-acetylmuramate dehydrogenase